ncbi:MAG TPA: hypothetical protein VIP57_09675 [Candidatus Dormibacteraeota bacterium]
MDAFTIVVTWVIAFTSGALAALGLAQAASGRVFRIFNRRRIAWTVGEVRFLGATWAVAGTSWAVWALFGALTFAHIVPMFWVGHWWGIFISFPVWLITMGSLAAQVLIELRHNQQWPFRGDRLRDSS